MRKTSDERAAPSANPARATKHNSRIRLDLTTPDPRAAVESAATSERAGFHAVHFSRMDALARALDGFADSWRYFARAKYGLFERDGILAGATGGRVNYCNQALVIDWTHSDVSGHHLEIVALDESGAQVVVHGDNGVSLDGTSHGPGAQFKWNLGQTLVLSGGAGQASSCTLTLSRSA